MYATCLPDLKHTHSVFQRETHVAKCKPNFCLFAIKSFIFQYLQIVK